MLKVPAAFALAAGLASATASASSQLEYVTYAKVVKSTPIVDRAMEREPVRRCSWEAAPGYTRYRWHDRRSDRLVKRCRTVYESRVAETVHGYRVTYRVGDETYHDRVTSDPGGHVRIRVKIKPLSDSRLTSE